jgi:YrbI family 3-deoxy-D-manno-octulosonate 8-phosphate phosphatase
VGAIVSAEQTRVVVVIPARGGSKGLPGKNLMRIGGISLIGRAVGAARGAALVDQILVSTDDPEIAAEARLAGAQTVLRPPDLASDHASSESAVLHALEGFPAGTVVALVQCTSPFVTADDVDSVVAPILSGRVDSAFTAAPHHGFLWRPDGSGVNHDPAVRHRRQDRLVEVIETGAAYAMSLAALRETGHRFSGRVLPVEADPARMLEIDGPADLERARALAPFLDRRSSEWPAAAEVDAVVFDFDGTMTDDRTIVDQDGREAVVVNRGDGLGVAALRRAGIALLILSTESNPVVAARGAKLGVPVLHGVEEKGSALSDWCARRAIPLARTAYVGNDVNDLPCLELVGWPIAVADAHDSVRARARTVTAARGGHGAVREIANRLLGDELRDGSESPALYR